MRSLSVYIRDSYASIARSDVQRYAHNQWFKDILSRFDKSRYRFLLCFILTGMAVTSVFLVMECRQGNWPVVLKIVASLLALIGLLVFFRLTKKKEIVVNIVLAFMPNAYILTVLAPHSRGLHSIMLLFLPLLITNLAIRNRGFIGWIAYYCLGMAAGACLPLLGVWTNWSGLFGYPLVLVFQAAAVIIFIASLVNNVGLMGILNGTIDRFLNDQVCGLPTIHVFHEDLREGGRAVVGILRVGNFKELATLFGYEFSESVLVECASKLKEVLSRRGATAYRLNGYDFGFLAPVAEEGAAACAAIVRGIYEGMQGPISWHGKNIEPVYNIGYTVAEGDNIDRALSEADLALKKGLDDKDAIVAFETAIDDRLKTEKTIGQLLLLSRNIKEGKLAAYHQLIVPLEREGIPWNESLLRIWDFASAYQPPGPYLPLLRSTGYDSDISDFMMSHASSFLERESCWLSINVNLKDLTRPPFIQRAAIVAERAAERGSRLILELLESDLMTSHESVIPIMEEFRLSKGMIAMDDFGSGYSNFGKLLSIPLDIVKFDGEFVRMAYANAIARSLLDRVSKSLKEAGIITVAEFIETEEQAEMLREMGIHYGQGYLWSKPAPAKT